MECAQTVFCPAKINLFLEVLDRRPDGYHNIDSIMQSVDLCDTVRVEIAPGGGRIALSCSDPSLPTDRRNTAALAAERFLAKAGRSDLDVRIDIDKKIPVAAGLAGGSADAAGVLIALDRLIPGIPADRLMEIARSVGADVPFCMRPGCARAQGIGEILTPLPGLTPEYTLVIAKGGEGVSTKAAYEALDAKSARSSADEMSAALLRADLSAVLDGLYNAFEDLVARERPAVNIAKNAMLHGGAHAALMSGSGPSVFGIFTDLDAAENVCAYLSGKGYFACVCSPVRG